MSPIVATPAAQGVKTVRLMALAIVIAVSLCSAGVFALLRVRSISTQPSAPAVPAAPVQPAGGQSSGANVNEVSGPLTDHEARAKAIHFYNTTGEWAGQYSIRIMRSRVETTGPNTASFHAQYTYTCIQRRCGGAQTGQDQRVFYFQRQGTGWAVIQMGGHMSATF